MSKVTCEIHKMIGELSDVNHRNEQKVLCIASWNGGDEKLEIRNYNTESKVLLKGIALTDDEAENLVYAMIGSPDINFDVGKVIELLKARSDLEVDVVKLIEAAGLESSEKEENIFPEGVDGEPITDAIPSGNLEITSGLGRIVPRQANMFIAYSHLTGKGRKKR